MGDAKRRGSREARMQDALSRLPPHRQHYGFVFDDSAEGARALDAFWEAGPEEFRESFRRNYAMLIEAGAKFTAFLGTAGFTGGSSLGANDLDELLDGVIPQMMSRAIDRGGMCAFALAVSDDVRPRLEARIHELSPILGPDGRPAANQRLRALLAKSATPTTEPRFGGTPIPYDHVVVDPSVRDRIADLVVPVADAWRREGKEDLARAALSPFAEVLPDGALCLFVPPPEGPIAQVFLGPHEWMTRADSMAKLRRDGARRWRPCWIWRPRTVALRSTRSWCRSPIRRPLPASPRRSSSRFAERPLTRARPC
jgi:hypothetical protein